MLVSPTALKVTAVPPAITILLYAGDALITISLPLGLKPSRSYCRS